MNEQPARDVVLVRAIESADTERAIFNNEDRAHASRAAAELARWRAASKQPATAESFIGQRAALLAETLRSARPIARAASALVWPSWFGVALPIVAFALGALLEHIADRQHVNVLAFPLLAIVVWNVIVYALLLVRVLMRAGGAKIDLRGPRRWLTAGRQRSLRNVTGTASASIGAFVAQWSELVAPLMAARAARVLHLAAAMFALGAVVGLYVRGLVFEYRAGWESTFLDAPAVHAILSFFLSPAAQLLGIAFPSVEDIAALRFTSGTPGSANAALWIHLYAVTVGAVVILPRLVLALFAVWQERRRAQRFVFDMNEPYFRRLAGSFVKGAPRLRVIPYSYTVDEAALSGLRAAAVVLLGDDADVALHPSVTFGAEASVSQMLTSADANVALTVALFSLAATPENENHGAFLKALRAAAPCRTPGRADRRVRLSTPARRSYRRGLPRALRKGATHGRIFAARSNSTPQFADLSAPDLPALERDLEQRAGRTCRVA